ncbi:hypothetical protein CWO23_15700 [Vibrio splendidus]|nr:hypothetical protein CWO23_15700 [Vibrio splendidus]
MAALVIAFSTLSMQARLQLGRGSNPSLLMYAYIENTPFDYTQTITSRYSQGNWTKGYYYQNGTSRFECSDDGVTWSKDTCK